MLIHAKAPFFRGSLMLISFLVLFAALLMPILRDENGKHVTGLEYADNVFNELSKGSSYFIPGVRENLKKVDGKVVTVTVKLKKAALAPVAAMALQTAGATDVSATDGKVTFTGDLGKILASATDDSDALYHNDADKVSQKYGGENALKVASAWWYLLSPSIKELQKQRLIAESRRNRRMLDELAAQLDRTIAQNTAAAAEAAYIVTATAGDTSASAMCIEISS